MADQPRIAWLEAVARDWLNTMLADNYECTCDLPGDMCPLCKCRIALGDCRACGARNGEKCDAGLHS